MSQSEMGMSLGTQSLLLLKTVTLMLQSHIVVVKTIGHFSHLCIVVCMCVFSNV